VLAPESASAHEQNAENLHEFVNRNDGQSPIRSMGMHSRGQWGRRCDGNLEDALGDRQNNFEQARRLDAQWAAMAGGACV